MVKSVLLFVQCTVLAKCEYYLFQRFVLLYFLFKVRAITLDDFFSFRCQSLSLSGRIKALLCLSTKAIYEDLSHCSPLFLSVSFWISPPRSRFRSFSISGNKKSSTTPTIRFILICQPLQLHLSSFFPQDVTSSSEISFTSG